MLYFGKSYYLVLARIAPDSTQDQRSSSVSVILSCMIRRQGSKGANTATAGVEVREEVIVEW